MAVWKASAHALPLIGVDLAITIVFMITLMFVLANKHNSLLAFASASVLCAGGKRTKQLKRLRRVLRWCSLMILQALWPLLAGTACTRGSTMQLLWARLHLCLFVVCLVSVCCISFWSLASLNKTVMSTLATQASAGTPSTARLQQLLSHLQRYARSTVLVVLCCTGFFFITPLITPAFPYVSYFVAVSALLNSSNYVFQLSRCKLMISIEVLNDRYGCSVAVSV